MSRLSKEILTILFKGQIATQDSDNVQEGRQRRTDMSGMQTRRPQEVAATAASGGNPEAQEEKVPQTPIKAEVKVGRNEPCPCGSGKKFKNCHGKVA